MLIQSLRTDQIEFPRNKKGTILKKLPKERKREERKNREIEKSTNR